MMIVTTSQQNSCSNMQKLARRRVRLHLRRLRHREYSKLRTLVPSVANNNKVSKVTVIEEAIKYIDSLHKALVERLQNVRRKYSHISVQDITLSQLAST
uniref:BHLH domain-containing protein n=1 Tax=Octopus bimaculoides TaxID=37653 RepID=A0A0L8GA64_OCTBM